MSGHARIAGPGGRIGSALRGSPAGRIGLLGLAALAVGALLAGWALTVILSPPGAAAGSVDFTTVTALDGEVGARLSLNVAAEWHSEPAGTNEAVGVVTSVDAVAGAVTEPGATLYSVNGRPVVVAQGEVPAFRPMTRGTSGPDTAQLQMMLGALGLYSGPVDGTIGAESAAAIERWQRSVGAEATGIVQLGDIVFVPSLPARLTLDTGVVKRGARLAGGEEVVLALGAAPDFTLPVGENQAAQISTGTRVEITSPSGPPWQAIVGGRAAAASGSTITIALERVLASGTVADLNAGTAAAAAAAATAAAPASICGPACDSVPVSGQALLPAQVVTVEPVQGTILPSVALRSDAQQRLSVIDDWGFVHPVTVTASARGMSVVAGIEPGLVVRVPDAAGVGDGGGNPGAGDHGDGNNSDGNPGDSNHGQRGEDAR